MDPWIVMPSLIAIAIVFVVLPIALGTYTAYRGPKTVRCPVDGQPAAIRVERGIAAVSAVAGVRAHCIASCSLWPGRVGCNEECLAAPMQDLPARA